MPFCSLRPGNASCCSTLKKRPKSKLKKWACRPRKSSTTSVLPALSKTLPNTLAAEELGFFTQLIEQYQHEHNVTALEIASALAKLVQGETPLVIQNLPKKPKEGRDDREGRDSRPSRGDRGDRPDRFERSHGDRERKPRRDFGASNIEMETFRIEVGHAHGVKPGNIVGAFANETGIDGDHIARIKIEHDYSTVELPAGMPKELFNELKKVRVVGHPLNISRLGSSEGKQHKHDDSSPKPDKSKKRLSSTSKRAKPKAVDA